MEWLRLGGGPMLLLLLLSLAAATLIIVKVWEFWEARVGQDAFVPGVVTAWRNGQLDQAQTLLQREKRSPLAQVLQQAVKLHEQGLADAALRERTEVIAQAQLAAMRSFFRALELIAQLAPLLGLFGTVLGMIDAFREMQSGGGSVDPARLAGGIWQALLTTAAGLGVAMPVMVALQGFERVVDRQRLMMESALTELFTTPPVTPAIPVTPAAQRARRAAR